jgi:micrococcal nuclease
MQILLVLIIAAVAAAQTSSVNGGLTPSASVMVRAVIDGETIEVATFGRVRLLGVDSPQATAPFAREAHERLAALVLRRWVRLDPEPPTRGVRGGHLAYVVRDDGLFVNVVLIREGFARVKASRAVVRRDELERAEAEARLFRRGIWSGARQTPRTSYTHRSDGGRSSSTSRPGPFGRGAKSRTRTTRPKSPKPKT